MVFRGTLIDVSFRLQVAPVFSLAMSDMSHIIFWIFASVVFLIRKLRERAMSISQSKMLSWRRMQSWEKEAHFKIIVSSLINDHKTSSAQTILMIFFSIELKFILYDNNFH